MKSTEHILAATQGAQLIFVAIVTVSCFILLVGARGSRINVAPLFICLGVYLFGAFCLFAMTDEASASRKTVLTLNFLPSVSGIIAVQSIFWLDLLCVFALVVASGGSISSCFSPLYFLLPTLAILLLRDYKDFLNTYITVVSGCFLVTLLVYRRNFLKYYDDSDGKRNVLLRVIDNMCNIANANIVTCGFVTLACFYLSLYIGETTKTADEPKPIVQGTEPASVTH